MLPSVFIEKIILCNVFYDRPGRIGQGKSLSMYAYACISDRTFPSQIARH